MEDVILSLVNTISFLLNLAVTVIFLALTIRSGKKGARKSHFYLVALTLLALLGAIWQAEMYGRDFVFDSVRLSVHLGFAFAALLCFPGVVFSGFKLISAPNWRLAHNRWVGAFVSLVGFAVLTAIWMFLDAQSKAQ
jgi:hypothetical protein